MLIALLANAVVKTGIALYSGAPAFARDVGCRICLMFAAGALARFARPA